MTTRSDVLVPLEHETHYFTFGSDHHTPLGVALFHEFVAVTAPRGWDHRALFIEWRGGNQFAFEYGPDEWDAVYSKHYAGKSPVATITLAVDERNAQ